MEALSGSERHVRLSFFETMILFSLIHLRQGKELILLLIPLFVFNGDAFFFFFFKRLLTAASS